MTIQGLRDTSGFTLTGQRPENWREGIMLLFPNGDTPLTAITSLLRSSSSDDPKYHWYEKTMSDQRIELNEDISVGETALTVVSGALEVRKGHILYMEESGELLLVTSDQTVDTTIASVVRSYGTVADTEVLYQGAGVNPFMLIIGSAYEEGSAAPKGVAYDPLEKFNLTQIFRNTLEATRTAVNTRLRTGDSIREAKREALQYHAIEMERAFWWGERVDTTLNSAPLRLTEGFFDYLRREDSTRIKTVGAGGLDMDELEEHLKDIFDYGSSEKMAFCGNRALLTIQQVIRKNSGTPYTITQGQKEFGMVVSRLTSPFGEIVLKAHPLFNRVFGGTNVVGGGTYNSTDGWMAVLDMASIKYRYLKNSDTDFTTNLQVPGEDQTKAGYLTEAGMQWMHAKSHFLLKDVVLAKADD